MAIETVFDQHSRDAAALRSELQASLAECRRKKREKQRAQQAAQRGDRTPGGWLGWAVGGKIFNDYDDWNSGGLSGGDGQEGPLEGGIFDPGDPGTGG